MHSLDPRMDIACGTVWIGWVLLVTHIIYSQPVQDLCYTSWIAPHIVPVPTTPGSKLYTIPVPTTLGCTMHVVPMLTSLGPALDMGTTCSRGPGTAEVGITCDTHTRWPEWCYMWWIGHVRTGKWRLWAQSSLGAKWVWHPWQFHSKAPSQGAAKMPYCRVSPWKSIAKNIKSLSSFTSGPQGSCRMGI